MRLSILYESDDWLEEPDDEGEMNVDNALRWRERDATRREIPTIHKTPEAYAIEAYKHLRKTMPHWKARAIAGQKLGVTPGEASDEMQRLLNARNRRRRRKIKK